MQPPDREGIYRSVFIGGVGELTVVNRAVVNAEYRCGMGIGLGLGVRASRVHGLARAWFGVRIRISFCSSIAQFLAILCIPHCADAEWVSH